MYLRMTLCVDAGMMELARFAPTLVAVLPPTTEDVSDWISVESEDNRPKLKEVLLRLQHASDNTEGYSEVMDTALWFICLIDVTATMCMPCVADVKLGFLRHSPQTPAAKLERIRKKRISQPYALRLCGAHHYVYHHSDNNERHLEVEWCEKDMGYALETEEEYRRVIRAFFSSTISMHADKTLKKNDDNDDVLLVESRLQYCRRVVERLLCFFTSSLGRALLEKTAFVSTSLLFVYDAGDNKKSDPCSDNSDRSHVYLIDYARSSDRRLNYTEETIGFVHGIENMLRFLS
ncbi:Inositol polyphosphate kinase [Trypanosoma melophagium]|uniref:Inositol polyphosphate kinase n=1 Tax=Trypanosoma melophagium TaxID=715481 RepID=UPI00351A17C9|nr:Inositol polyphosphate kinase [Trypanosoma melophagium]